MGGPGSGMWYRWDTRTTLDQVHQLDVRWLHRHGYLDRIGKCIFPVLEAPVTQGQARQVRIPG